MNMNSISKSSSFKFTLYKIAANTNHLKEYYLDDSFSLTIRIVNI